MRKFIHIIAICGIALASAACSQKEVTGPGPGGAAKGISLGATTTRTAIATLATLEDGTVGGFHVWATATDQPANWAKFGSAERIAGIKHAKDGDGIWNFAPPIPWPAAGYPLDFYAFWPEPGATPGLVFTDTAASQLLGATYTVPATAATQTDLLFAHARTDAKPLGSNLVMTFDHLLSKIDYGVTLAAGYDFYIQGLRLNNVSGSGTIANFITAPVWNAEATYTTGYGYYGTIHAAPTGHATDLATAPITASGPFYAGNHSNHLMLMPQTAAGQLWADPGVAGTVPGTKSFVEVVYRLETAADNRLVGYAQAQDHPYWSKLTAPEQAAIGADKPLFVKVGFPFALSWDMKKGYMYNLAFDGSDSMTGGYLIDQMFYDEHGDRTVLAVGDVTGDNVPDYPTVPEPIFNTDGAIHLVPVVTQWSDQAATGLGLAN